MRFINTSSLTFHEVSDLEPDTLPNGYSILSHRWTWGDNEIMYADILSTSRHVKAKGGYAKLTGACTLAKALGYDLMWINTCCINNSDAVEMGEAINSMWCWYLLARVCIVYLEDVNDAGAIKESEWFERG